MFNKEEYDTIVSECKKNSKLSSALSDLRKDSGRAVGRFPRNKKLRSLS